MQGAKPSGAGGPMAPAVPNPFYMGAGGAGQQPQQHAYGQSSGENLSHVHPDIRTAMQAYHDKFVGQVAVQRLLEAANLTFKDLPYLTNLMDMAGKNGYVTIIVCVYAKMERAVCFTGREDM